MYALRLGESGAALNKGGVGQVDLAEAMPAYALLTGAYWKLKRPLGLVLSLILAIVTLPLLLGISLVLARQGRPVFIRCKRLGQYGRPFTSYYFRTMVPDSVWALQDHGDQAAPVRDAFGHFLLRTKLDRLPLLWNVIKGDMNLIGPRCLSQEELIGSGRAARHTLSVRPGITGLWWLDGETDLRRRLALDRSYIEHISPLFDARILMRTVLLVYNGGGRTEAKNGA